MDNKNKNSLFGNKYVNVKQNSLYLANIKVLDIAKEFSTPTFIYLNNKIQDNILKIKETFSEIFPNSQGFYSMKANFFESVLKTVKNCQFGAEIVGIPELDILTKINFPLKIVIAGGPYLPNLFLNKLINRKIGYIVIYDIEDIQRIQNKIEELGLTSSYHQKILIRFRSPKFTGRQGIELNNDNLQRINKIFNTCKNLQFKGILSHFGTRLKTIKNYEDNFNFIVSIMNSIKEVFKNYPEIIDIGGGFSNADSLKIGQLNNILRNMRDLLSENDINNYQIFYEPGRFITEDAGFCISKVFRYNNETKTVFLNIGNNYIPKFIKSSLRFYNASKICDSPNKSVDFMGPIPSDQDILAKNYNFTPSVTKGDIVLISNVGAYAYTWSTRFPYNSPSILFLTDDNIIPINNLQQL